MAFDMGFNFRGTAGYVTDQSYAVPGLGEAYPHTYTNANGDSINAGAGGEAALDRVATNDARIAGINYVSNTLTKVWRVDLSSGSAPGASTYTIDLAVGDASAGHSAQWFQVFDTSTLLIDGSGGGAGLSTTTGHFIDASLANVAATTSWTGTPVSKTFATTIVELQYGLNGLADVTSVAHFRLTLGTPTPPSGVTGMPWWLIGPTILPGSDLMRSF